MSRFKGVSIGLKLLCGYVLLSEITTLQDSSDCVVIVCYINCGPIGFIAVQGVELL